MKAEPLQIPALEELARTMVGDGQEPDRFFVTDRGVVVTVTDDFSLAYSAWCQLAGRSPRMESALENRTFGVIADVAPTVDDSPILIITDDSPLFLRLRDEDVREIASARDQRE